MTTCDGILETFVCDEEGSISVPHTPITVPLITAACCSNSASAIGQSSSWPIELIGEKTAEVRHEGFLFP